ncbi:hypothetical protein AXG93_1028s1220 [Marchantia polymorpha subsp. ruderalis]|uniref:Fungal lipase-like domain-containing protein n=1 Tax=Marchantia polymorpha subsp. ruderalis TaxID=1480154 RepID=A0A176W8Y2_MARPO|nr:hypothetical protein AXG93_1028s1220 [Marchantia polymorpha subsp. ruderalis]
MVLGTLLVAGIGYKAYVVYNRRKERTAKKNDPELIFHANDQQEANIASNIKKKNEAKKNDPELILHANNEQDDASERKIKKRAIHGRLIYGMYDRFKDKPAKKYQKWWTKVHYDLVPLESVFTEDELHLYAKELHEERQNMYFGVFRRNKERPSAEAPDWVVAIRGTKLSAWADLQNDLGIVLETLNSSTLIALLYYVVWRLCAQHGYCNVNVTGHSLGAAAGLMVCRRLALEGCLVEGHFFNPPFTTLESLARSCAHFVERVIIDALPERVGHFYDLAKSTGKSLYHEVAGTDTENATRRKQALAEFKTLAKANWSPYLYVNKHDFICCEFLQHFTNGPVGEDPKKWYSSFTELSKKFLGEKFRRETETFHLFPSAHLVMIETHLFRPVSAHKLWNWIDPHLSYKFKHAKLIQ